jgi:hypothetical protein
MLGREYQVVSDYKGIFSKVDVFHTKCGKTYKELAIRLLSGKKCSCLKKKLNNIDNIKEITFGEYEVVDKSINSDSLIEVKHNKCGSAFWIEPHDFFSIDIPCPECRRYEIPKIEQEELLKQIRCEYRVKLNTY